MRNAFKMPSIEIQEMVYNEKMDEDIENISESVDMKIDDSPIRIPIQNI